MTTEVLAAIHAPEDAQRSSVPLYDLQTMAMTRVDLWSLEADDV